MSWLDKVNASRSVIRSVATQLDNISDLLFAVGLDKLAKRLDDQSERLQAAEDNLDVMTSEKLSEDLHTAVNGSLNVLKATIAGAAMESKDPKRIEDARAFIGDNP